jgi:hypothetical protein
MAGKSLSQADEVRVQSKWLTFYNLRDLLSNITCRFSICQIASFDGCQYVTSKYFLEQTNVSLGWRGAAPTGRKRSGSASQANPEPVKKGRPADIFTT